MWGAEVIGGVSGGVMRKVPEVTAIFWAIKIASTGMGETTSDYLVRLIDPVIAVACGALGLGIALVIQLTVRRYIPWAYWLAVVMVSVFGTMAADVLHIGLGVPYLISTGVFAVALAGILLVWFLVEGTLSIHSIASRRREAFYWATVLATFALGTAVGDLTATTLNLGYLASGALFLLVIAVPAVAHWSRRANPVVTFWFAYIVTRPLGASLADWVGLPHWRGGLGWGTGPVSAALGVLIVGLVGFLSVAKNERVRGTPEPGLAARPGLRAD